MSKAGLPTQSIPSAEGLRVAIVASRWNTKICDQLVERAEQTAKEAGAQCTTFRVMGALEIPVVVQKAAMLYDAVVALGCVIQGGTPHFEYVCDSVTAGLTRLALDTRTPIGNGILTTHTQQQAKERAGFPDSVEDKGAEAMIAALDTALVLQRMV